MIRTLVINPSCAATFAELQHPQTSDPDPFRNDLPLPPGVMRPRLAPPVILDRGRGTLQPEN